MVTGEPGGGGGRRSGNGKKKDKVDTNTVLMYENLKNTPEIK